MLDNPRFTMAALLAACVALASCGTAKKDAVVVRVGDSSITQATLDHWIHIEAVASHEHSPKPPTPKGLIPVPPDYADCVALLRKEANVNLKPTTAELKHECAAKYDLIKNDVLEKLITYHWIVGEGSQKGVQVTDAEVARFLHARFPTNGALEQFLEATGASAADERMLEKRVLLSDKLQSLAAKNAHTAEERFQATATFAKALAAKWAPKTNCRPGYVVEQCRQYRGARE